MDSISACAGTEGRLRTASGDDGDGSPRLAPPRTRAIELQRAPEIVVREDEGEARRHHANHLGRLVAEENGPADDTRIAAEASVPETVAEDGDARRVRTVVICGDDASEQRADAEQREELRRHHLRLQARRISGLGQRQRRRAPGGEPLDRAALGLPVDPVRRRHRQVAARRVNPLAGLDVEGFVDGDQPVAARIRQRPQQQLVDDGEDGGVAADPEPQRQDDGGREAGALAQSACHVPHVAYQIVDDAGRPDVVAAFLESAEVAEPGPRRAHRLGVRHAGLDVLLPDRFEVEAHFAVHLVLASVPGEWRQDASQPTWQSKRHVRPPARWRAARA